MVSINDAVNTVEKDNSYIILPNSDYNKLNVNSYLKKYKNSKRVKDNFSYNSFDNKYFLSEKEIKKLILQIQNQPEV